MVLLKECETNKMPLALWVCMEISSFSCLFFASSSSGQNLPNTYWHPLFFPPAIEMDTISSHSWGSLRFSKYCFFNSSVGNLTLRWFYLCLFQSRWRQGWKRKYIYCIVMSSYSYSLTWPFDWNIVPVSVLKGLEIISIYAVVLIKGVFMFLLRHFLLVPLRLTF